MPTAPRGSDVKLSAFERRARRLYDDIPEQFREGIDGLVISREAPRHPTMPGVFTMGECLTEEHLSDYGGPDTTRSVIVLYWGAFRAISLKDPDFDWEGEIWETLTHELRHHLESLAGDDELEGVDYAADQMFQRREGLAFDPWYYQHGERLEAGIFRVEDELYLEQLWSQVDFDAADSIDFEWDGARYRIARPDELGDVHFVFVGEVDDAGTALELVLVRRRRWWEELKRLAGTSRPVVLESDAEARPTA